MAAGGILITISAVISRCVRQCDCVTAAASATAWLRFGPRDTCEVIVILMMLACESDLPVTITNSNLKLHWHNLAAPSHCPLPCACIAPR